VIVVSVKEAIGFLRHECGDWMRAMQGSESCFVRGIREALGKDTEILQGMVRSDRKPIMMGEKYQALIDEAMESLGMRARRGNSLFMSSSRDMAASWGALYIPVMKDGWSATAFSTIKHGYAFSALKNTAMKILDEDDDKYSDERVDQVNRMAKELQRRNIFSIDTVPQLTQAMRDKYDDVLVTGTRYYALRANAIKTEQILSDFGFGSISQIKNFIDEY
jgi:hypothetical protein